MEAHVIFDLVTWVTFQSFLFNFVAIKINIHSKDNDLNNVFFSYDSLFLLKFLLLKKTYLFLLG